MLINPCLSNEQLSKTNPLFVTGEAVGLCNLQCIVFPYYTFQKNNNPLACIFPFKVFHRFWDDLNEHDTHSLVSLAKGNGDT
jgi:hypothetical protein